MTSFSPLHLDQINEVLKIDEYSYTHPERKEQIVRAIKEGAAYALMKNTSLVGYAIFRPYGFLEESFLHLIVISEKFRGQGYAKIFLSHLETLVPSSRIHVSTNTSNVSMRSLLTGLGYKEGGIITSIDPSDPEIF